MQIKTEDADSQDVIIHGVRIEHVSAWYRVVFALCYRLAGEMERSTLSGRIESTFEHIAVLPKQPD